MRIVDGSLRRLVMPLPHATVVAIPGIWSRAFAIAPQPIPLFLFEGSLSVVSVAFWQMNKKQ